MSISNLLERLSEIAFRLDIVEPTSLCRTANYAERRRNASSPPRQWPNGGKQRSA
jgi:hypothetical protein